MNRMIVTEIHKTGTKIAYDYKVEGEWEKYFNLHLPFFSEYDYDITGIPDSIALLPLIGNVLVLASIVNAQIVVEELDRSFYSGINDILDGYASMSRHIHFHRDIIRYSRLIDNAPYNTGEKAAMFFSGGVDAWNTLIHHIEEKPELITIWGADIAADNETGWQQVLVRQKEIAEHWQLNLLAIHANLRSFVNEKQLNHLGYDLVRDNYWSAFHHSVGMLALAAPYVFGHTKNLYFASTYSVKDRIFNDVTASIPKVDNYVQLGGCRVIHDGIEYSRLEKIENIYRYKHKWNAFMPVRVCYTSTDGSNCGRCEKCVLAMLSLMILGEDERKYGFPFRIAEKPEYFTAAILDFSDTANYFYFVFYDIHKAMRDKLTLADIPKEWHVFYKMEFEDLLPFILRNINKEIEKPAKDDMDLKRFQLLEEENQKLIDRISAADLLWKEQQDWIHHNELIIADLNKKNEKLMNELTGIYKRNIVYRLMRYSKRLNPFMK